MTAHISLHTAARDETRRQAAVADSLRRRAHTRATVAEQLSRPGGPPPIYRETQAALSKEAS